jgi:hypothetical protein
MLSEAIGDLLPAAVGVALSPVPIVAVILMLGTPRARSNGPAFAAGWVAGLVTVGVIVLLVAGDAGPTRSPPAGDNSTAAHREAGSRLMFSPTLMSTDTRVPFGHIDSAPRPVAVAAA